MSKDAPDVTTIPPPAGGDVYAAETMVGSAPADVIAELRAPTAPTGLEPDDVETIVFAQAASEHGAGTSAGCEAAPGAEAHGVSGNRRWPLLVLFTVLVCVLMFFLGRLL